MTGIFGGEAATFYIQVSPREPWHIESPEHCEFMLCGLVVSVDLNVRIRSGAAPSRALGCADCWLVNERAKAGEYAVPR